MRAKLFELCRREKCCYYIVSNVQQKVQQSCLCSVDMENATFCRCCSIEKCTQQREINSGIEKPNDSHLLFYLNLLNVEIPGKIQRAALLKTIQACSENEVKKYGMFASHDVFYGSV